MIMSRNDLINLMARAMDETFANPDPNDLHPLSLDEATVALEALEKVGYILLPSAMPDGFPDIVSETFGISNKEETIAFWQKLLKSLEKND
jgi:hypothetical protein